MNRLIIISLFIIFNFAFSNVGGTFYRHSIAGLALDSGTTVTSANTKITCIDSNCTFKTIYKTNSNGRTFAGRFYGVRFNNIFVNENAVVSDTSSMSGFANDSALFGNNWVIENYSGQIKYKSIPIIAEVNNDSTFTISGNLLPMAGQNWGLAGVPGITYFRHPLLTKLEKDRNEYSVIYCFAPIESFKGITNVSVQFEGTNIELLKREVKWKEKKQALIAFKTGINNDSASFNDSIPYMVRFDFKEKKSADIGKNQRIFSIGGPLLFVGTRSGSIHSEIGWESGFNILDFALMPSVNISANPNGYYDSSIGLRLMTMGCSAGVIFRSGKSIEGSLGLSLGIIGVEFRNKGVFLHLSI